MEMRLLKALVGQVISSNNNNTLKSSLTCEIGELYRITGTPIRPQTPIITIRRSKFNKDLLFHFDLEEALKSV